MSMGQPPTVKLDPHSDVVTWDDILARPRISTMLFLPICALCVGLFVFWAANAPLDEVARGQGRVIPTSQIQVVQNLEGGILSELLVREGQKVAKGQVLVRIDDTSLASSFREQRVRYLGLLAAIARLEGEANGRAIVYPPEVLKEPSLSERETELHNSRLSTLESSVGALRQQVDQRRSEISETENKISSLERSVSYANEELRFTEPLFEQGAVSRVELLRLQREVNEMTGTLKSTRINLEKARQALREAQQRVDEKISAFKTESLSQLGENRTKLASLQETQSAAEDRVNRTEVRAPLDGIVKKLNINTVGGVIKPGADILELVPIDDTLMIEAKVSPTDIAFIRPGQEAIIKLTAYDFAIYGSIPGTIEQVGADSIVDDKGNITYQVLVRTNEKKLQKANKDIEIIPGMVAEVDVLTGKRTVLQYLMKPVMRMREYGLRER